MAKQMDQVYEIIRARIIDGTYSPSQTLVESSLSAELGASRSTIKKALMKLVSERLVEIEANKSACVKSLTPEAAVYLLEVREKLEGLIAYKAAEVIADEELDNLRSILSEMKRCLQEHKLLEYSSYNQKFHEVIYSSCPNKAAVELVLSIKLQLRRYNVKTILVSGRDKGSLSEHMSLLEALENHDAEGAERAICRHIANVRNTLIENYTLLI